MLLEISPEVHRIPIKPKDSAMLSKENVVEPHNMLALYLGSVMKNPVFKIELLSQRVILPETLISVVPVVISAISCDSNWLEQSLLLLNTTDSFLKH